MLFLPIVIKRLGHHHSEAKIVKQGCWNYCDFIFLLQPFQTLNFTKIRNFEDCFRPGRRREVYGGNVAIVLETHLLHSTFTHFNNALMHAINFTVRKLKMNVIQFWLASLLNQGFYKSGLYAAKFDTTQCTQATHRLKSWSIVSTNLATSKSYKIIGTSLQYFSCHDNKTSDNFSCFTLNIYYTIKNQFYEKP